MNKHDDDAHAKMLEETRLAREAQFSRKELQGLVSRARLLGSTTPNPTWKRCYEDLRQAASNLDAFHARSTVHVHPQPPKD